MNFEPIKDFMDRLTSWRIPGNSISIYKDGKEVFTYQSGYNDLEKLTPMTGNELLYIYSCSKIAMVIAALQLYEKGLYLLDDPLYDFIPEFKKMHKKNSEGKVEETKKPITIRQLFTMTSGFNYSMSDDIRKMAHTATNGHMDTLTVIKKMSECLLDFEPGERWQYGYSHDILAAFVEVISGERFADYVKNHIFIPLEMNDSYYHDSEIIDLKDYVNNL